MIPQVTARVEEAYELLSGVADRLGNQTPAWYDVADEIFDRQKRFWLTEYADETDKDSRPGRNPAYMEETGGLRRSATVKGASRQTIRYGRNYLFIGITHGLAVIHEDRGRKVLDEPSRMDAARYAGHVARYILTGRR